MVHKPDPAPPATLVIFGAMGDLAKRLLMPALANLTKAGLLDAGTHILGVSYHEGDDAKLREQLGSFIDDGDEGWSRLRERVTYFKGDFNDAATYEGLAKTLDGNAVFYLATAPNFFGPVVEKLGDAGLFDEKDGFRRIVIEKPFGTDLASAKALNEQILKRANETQVFRIDHFLGKETVQNIMVARFGNALLEAVWNNRYIDHVEITAAEAVGVGTRGKFYDATGALRDMVPNHLFQLLALVGMEPPNGFDAAAVLAEKSKLIAAVRPADPAEAARGRYTEGKVGDEEVKPYLDTEEVAPDSRTETYAALKLMVDTWRWSGVPFYLRTGKAMTRRDTEIVVWFKDAPLALFRESDVDALPPNRLIIQIQPDEGICFDFAAKCPGPVVDVAPVTMAFRYSDAFTLGHQTGYETLLYDVLVGEQTLFQRADHIEGGWRAVQPLLDAWAKDGAPEDYPAGSEGPPGADALMAHDDRTWHALG